jgi:hypothetical protein
LHLYCHLPFGKIHARNPQIIELAGVLGRTPSAVALKMVNFASLDPTIDQKGLGNVSTLDRLVWQKFFENIDQYLEGDERGLSGLSEAPQDSYDYQAFDVIELAKSRRGQQKFRRMILASYEQRCAISGIDDDRLLVASHIAPWATRTDRRLDPRNGICLNSLLDRAFDNGLISVSNDYEIMYSRQLSEDNTKKLMQFGSAFSLPHRFKPDADLLREHRKRFDFE